MIQGELKHTFTASPLKLHLFLLLDRITPNSPRQLPQRAKIKKCIYKREAETERQTDTPIHTHEKLWMISRIAALHLYLMPDLSYGALVLNYGTQDFNFILLQVKDVLLQLNTQTESGVVFTS